MLIPLPRHGSSLKLGWLAAEPFFVGIPLQGNFPGPSGEVPWIQFFKNCQPWWLTPALGRLPALREVSASSPAEDLPGREVAGP